MLWLVVQELGLSAGLFKQSYSHLCLALTICAESPSFLFASGVDTVLERDS